jgi:uncharacterized integral membrane protein
MAIALLLVALLIALLTLVFAVANSTPVTINLLFAQIPTQLSLALIVPFIAGLATGILVMLPGSIKNSVVMTLNKKKIAELEKAAYGTRILPPDPGTEKKP